MTKFFSFEEKKDQASRSSILEDKNKPYKANFLYFTTSSHAHIKQKR